MKEKELREKLKNCIGDLLDGLTVLEIKEEVPIGGGRQRLFADMVVTVEVGNQRRKLVIECKQRGYPRELEQGILAVRKRTENRPEYIPVLVVPFISESGRKLVRMQGINYLDLSGNAYIAFDNVLIHKTSPRNEFPYEKQGVDIFSDKASLILRELLAQPEEYHTVRGLADTTSISVGWTSEVLREIEERGYVDRKPRQGCRIQRIENLLDDWTSKYNYLDKNRIRRFFIAAESLDEILTKLRMSAVSKEVGYALTLHGGARLVSPFVQYNECHIYIDVQKDFDQQIQCLVEALSLSEPPVGGNFHIVRPYYEKGAFYETRILDGLRVVSDLQLYLDLLKFPVRGREQAEKVIEHSGLRNSNSWR